MSAIYHNPRCSTSRNALERLQQAGYEPQVIEYLKTPPDAGTLAELIRDAGLSVRDAIRTKEPEYLEQGLDDPSLGDEVLLAKMVATPVLINRPFVRTEKGARLCRPVSVLEDIL
ncbi:arsenate reductase (glutaredoxin) [Paracandidimonas soli]|uniref:Arsenate reductase n=1 Tax=Paracandidimonas soli TaxID=1917182 RepID=A0A4R3V997_9BURK|nr:arsenate reductase (glutaredoxin) [Paracandidimonas soli]TCV01756.1 arsenate reductase [Paracandidimonas soli]